MTEPKTISPTSVETLEASLQQFGPSQDGAVERDLRAAKMTEPKTAEEWAEEIDKTCCWEGGGVAIGKTSLVIKRAIAQARREALKEAINVLPVDSAYRHEIRSLMTTEEKHP